MIFAGDQKVLNARNENEHVLKTFIRNLFLLILAVLKMTESVYFKLNTQNWVGQNGAKLKK